MVKVQARNSNLFSGSSISPLHVVNPLSLDPAVRRRLLTFVVVGGGYSGVETAGQISDLLRDVHRFYPRLDPKEFRLVLVHSGPYLLPQIGEKLGRYCGEHLQKRGIEVRLNAICAPAGYPVGQEPPGPQSQPPPAALRFKALGEMASLGHLNAVGDVLGFKVSGLFAWLLWRAIYLSKLPGLQRKLQVFLEWTLELVFPRDISLLDIKMTEVVGRVHLEKGDPVYDIGDPAFSFYVIEQGQVELADEHGPVRTLRPGQHFGERELLRNLKRQFNATAVEPTTLLALNKATFEALAQNSLTLGYLLSRSAVEYLRPAERKAIVDQAPSALRDQRVADFMRADPVVVRETDSVGSALKTFQQAAAPLLPVVDEAQRCKGWLRLEFVFDPLHQGKAPVESPVHDLLILPFIGVKPDERVEQALLRFAQTADREFAVENREGQLIGTLALLDLVLAEEAAAEPSSRELASAFGDAALDKGSLPKMSSGSGKRATTSAIDEAGHM